MMVYCTQKTFKEVKEMVNPIPDPDWQSIFFEEQKYLVLRNFFETKDVDRMRKRMWHLKQNNALVVDPQCPKSYSIYGDPIQSEMMLKYQDKLENAIKKKLFPTYPYARIYQPKEVLSYHADRPSCEISITSTLDYDTYNEDPWPIFVESDGAEAIPSKIIMENTGQTEEKLGKAYFLYPGDILVYKGCELPHWREQFVGVSQTQVFMHYVDANGPYGEEYKYDGRSSMGSSGKVKRLEPERF
jgi:hypothetical protein